jgi:signal transduction histidine kinase
MVLASIVLAAIVTIALLRESRSVQIANAQRGLEGEMDEIFAAYERIQPTLERGSDGPVTPANEAVLRGLMTRALSDDPGMEGGFFDAAGTHLLGYAAPTDTDPDRSQPTNEVKQGAERVARRAFVRRADGTLIIDSGGNVLLFRARVLSTGASVEGAVWTMQRLPGLGALRGRVYRTSLIVLLVLTIATTALAWRFTHHLDRAVHTIEEALAAKESRPDDPVPTTRFEEIDRIGAGIDHLARSLEEHRRQRETLEDRLHRADRLAALGKLVAGVAHEVRNPLASIKLKLHLLRLDRDGSKAEAAFSVIQEEISRLDRMVARLLTISKVAANLRHRATGSGWPGRGAVGVLVGQGLGARRSPAVEVEPATRGGAAVDADTVVPILDNLLSNAIGPSNRRAGAVVVALERRTPSELAVTVSDTGPGVEPAAVDRLFEPFFTTRAGGTGLGLFLSAEMARRIGGEIRHSRALGGGASFELRVPC